MTKAYTPMTGNIYNRIKREQSVSELMNGLNLQRASDMTDLPETRNVKAKRPTVDKKSEAEPERISLNPKKPLSEKRIPFPNRVNETVVEAFKSQSDTSAHVEKALLEYAVRNGWL